jgi:hypothetical protein
MPNKQLTWLGLALLAALSIEANAETAELPPLPDRNPLRSKVETTAAPVLPGDRPTVPWTEAEIAAATAKCKALLTDGSFDYDPLPPIKEGLCGAPAPILLRSVGDDPKVTIDPPATLDCRMAGTLREWLRDAVQPEAKKLLGSAVVKIHNATSYACRNRYGGKNTPLSEHALANALDVSEFVLADGARITVLKDWPRVAAAPPPPPEPNPLRLAPATAPNAPAKQKSIIAQAKAEPGTAPSPPPVAAEPAAPDPKNQFVTFLFDQACQRFGTVLGPNANAAHKDHFHLDMKARRRANYCE